MGEIFTDLYMRFYDINDKKFPSVTTVLSGSRPQSSEDALGRWRDRVGEEEANRKFLSACDRGTKAHKLAEQFLLGDKLDYLGNEKGIIYFESMLPRLNEISELVFSEQRVHHNELEYGGTLDCYATFRGVPNTLTDFKTADKPKESKGIHDYFLQAVAYSACVYDLFGIQTNQAAIIIGLPDQEAQVFILTREDMLKKWWGKWIERLNIFKAKYPENK